ncbi:AAA domain-containing protein [Phialemonium atrogriseum]|uniref:AAA domain-containing protein n=1 Tax=Phialemonium atrogriseum TaxID=1093897 RepID=A0AAJ0FIY6_9PEZI|nr:AAA domain-containing protein [Phialemonium atrogriseum]KAK1763799.1 AAA domain-containing protein [Phialemonium atrogriseum]
MSSEQKIPNIYIIGAQCTGKTTLVNRLSVELYCSSAVLGIDKPQIISEVARTVLKQHQFVTEDIRSFPERSLALQQLIVAAQVDAERDALSRSSWFISDRSGIDPVVYASKYVSGESAMEMQRSTGWLELKERMAESLVIVCEAGATWLKDDGVRLMPEDQEDWLQFHRMFCTLLDESRLPYCVLPCNIHSLSERAQFVLSKWHELANIAPGLARIG